MLGLRVTVLVSVLAAGAFAQATPDEAWNAPPESTTPPPPPPPARPLPVSPPRTSFDAAYPPGWRAPPPQTLTAPPVIREEPNHTSLFGGPTLGPWKRGASFLLGFPLLSMRAAIGLSERLDLGVGFDTMYLLMNEPRLTARYGGWTTGEWTLSGAFEVGWAFFQMKAAHETNGPRWMTGRRNLNLSPMAQVSYQGAHPRAARFVMDLGYTLAFDFEPYSKDPLGGVPPSLVLGHNVMFRFGAELPLSAKTSFVFLLGLDVHTRDVDSPVMPSASVGVVTNL